MTEDIDGEFGAGPLVVGIVDAKLQRAACVADQKPGAEEIDRVADMEVAAWGGAIRDRIVMAKGLDFNGKGLQGTPFGTCRNMVLSAASVLGFIGVGDGRMG